MVKITSGLVITRNDSELETYIKTIIFPGITDADYQALAQAYPSDVTQGSPFGTGHLNALTPEYKRLAAIVGDFNFQSPRRLFLNQLSGRQDAWAYCEQAFSLSRSKLRSFLVNKRLKSTDIVGSVSSN